MTNSEDDEWEYEYDETETEDFYIPLDLSNVPAAQIPMVSQSRPGHPTLLKSRLRALNAARGQPVEVAAGANARQETANMGEVQVIGLHTPNPLVMYNGQLLSCHWTSTIGTDMFFVKPDADTTQPLRSLPSVDLLSLGSAKLVAKVGRLRPRDDVNHADDAQEPTESMQGAGDGSSRAAATSGESEGQQSGGEAKPTSTNFLARLNEAKLKRGEKSQLAISKTSDGSRLVVEKANVVTGAPSQENDDTVMGGV
ncbi:hypothetical protein COCSADRAFT_37274 [Bipolaris sorokiniana ND90Pr]|uniref:Transcription factor TFIIIC triple barrel domain-containing protein n=1 Tax=Cochliobolus sativus (strain ND90Pr / ATCC 201652) TaxID=665912 RepID=M2SMH3_COCSN|nr:uncharacterized protein COCSADRAFT_37274 [Bipolaris sorokiniana ND90Pr]EMD63495.1 hypothetical protein COCSADRAFT_37274 [Bipolaris sorokiniana ND90Pr]